MLLLITQFTLVQLIIFPKYNLLIVGGKILLGAPTLFTSLCETPQTFYEVLKKEKNLGDIKRPIH